MATRGRLCLNPKPQTLYGFKASSLIHTKSVFPHLAMATRGRLCLQLHHQGLWPLGVEPLVTLELIRVACAGERKQNQSIARSCRIRGHITLTSQHHVTMPKALHSCSQASSPVCIHLFKAMDAYTHCNMQERAWSIPESACLAEGCMAVKSWP